MTTVTIVPHSCQSPLLFYSFLLCINSFSLAHLFLISAPLSLLLSRTSVCSLSSPCTSPYRLREPFSYENPRSQSQLYSGSILYHLSLCIGLQAASASQNGEQDLLQRTTPCVGGGRIDGGRWRCFWTEIKTEMWHREKERGRGWRMFNGKSGNKGGRGVFGGKKWKQREMNVRGREISRKTDEVKERANELQ